MRTIRATNQEVLDWLMLYLSVGAAPAARASMMSPLVSAANKHFSAKPRLQSDEQRRTDYWQVEQCVKKLRKFGLVRYIRGGPAGPGWVKVKK